MGDDMIEANKILFEREVAISLIQSVKETGEEVNKLQKVIKELDDNLTSQTVHLSKTISQAVENLEGAEKLISSHLNQLNINIAEFNNSTTDMSKKANTLIGWYVALTFVIAASTVVALIK